MDAVHSGTGVFYQAIPAIGADGKNIMKLIPVQMVDGHFFRTQISKPKTSPTPQKAITISIPSSPVQVVRKAVLNPSATQQVVRKQVSLVNALPNQVCLDPSNSINKHSLQQQTVKLMAKVLQMASPATANCETSGRLPGQHSVTVQSPALPKGQCLQIPPCAQIRKIPTSGIKKQIFISSAGSSPGSSVSSVVSMSPITTVNQGVCACHSLNLLSKTSNKTSCGPPSKGSKKHLKLIPAVSQRPNSPIKWMVEEEESSTAPTLNPLHSPSVTSEILSAVAEREKASKQHHDISTKPFSQLNQGKCAVQKEVSTKPFSQLNQGKCAVQEMVSTKPFSQLKQGKCAVQEKVSTKPFSQLNQGKCAVQEKVSTKPFSQLNQGKCAVQEKVTFMCNGKVFFVVKKDSLPAKVGKGELPAAVTKSYEFNKMEVPSSQPSLESAATETRQHLSIIIPDESDEVIDLCDDDQGDSSQQAAVTHWDEDNVIFVSYIPPTSESGSAQDLILKETDQMGTHSSSSVTEQKCLDGPTGSDGRDEICALGGRKPVNNLTHVCGSAVVKMHDNEGSNINCQQSVTTQQLESVDVETESPAEPGPSDGSSRVCSLIEKDTHKIESSMYHTTSSTSSLAPKSCQLADHTLRQMFRITADVKICLQRIDEASNGFIWTVEDHHDPMSGLKEKEPSLQNLNSPQDTDSNNSLINVKRGKLLNTKPLSAFKYHSDQSSLRGTSCDVEAEPVIGYVEPIDEDILSTEENDILNSQDCVDLNTNTRRVGRTRKRTFCPCCIPGTEVPAVKSSPKSVETENWSCKTEQMSKKGGRPKAVRKAFKTSGGISFLTAKNRQNSKKCEGPASDSLSTMSMDSDELSQHEQIKRLKELLREKEAALELMRNKY
ncbi:uncharacterized protein lrif1 [Pagrus major]|uniref:uncharacterized protein lrif1 n=1 Tax=Pagrus major TaxID=143350 RepID=UPI003CC845BB